MIAQNIDVLLTPRHSHLLNTGSMATTNNNV
jgi:hypothetical protein